MKAAVLGSPIAHSLSPALHRAAYRWLALDWTYEAVLCTQDQLPAFLKSLDHSWAGLSLTMPLKASVLPLLDEVTAEARLVGGANTIVRRQGRLLGSNTDIPGIAAALRDQGVASGQPSAVTVLGAGATARSALAGLAELGVEAVDVYARSPEARAAMASLGSALGVTVADFGWEYAPRGLAQWLVLSTVPAGVADHLVELVPQGDVGVLFDVVYAPWPTPLADRWMRAGGLVVGGLDLLVQQAARQVRAMTGTQASAEDLVAVMRPAAAAALAAF